MTHRTEQCCKECSGWEPALHECSCQCHYSSTDESVVEFDARTFVKKARAQNWKNGGVLCHDDDELIEELESLLTSKDAQHKAEVEKVVREEREAVVRIAECYMNVVDFNYFCEELNEPELTLTNTEPLQATPEGTKD